MRQTRKIKYRGGPSEILEAIEFNGYTIKSLKHGNTGHILYRFPSKTHNWEPCWAMDLATAKNGVNKYNQHLHGKDTEQSEIPVESNT